jgi:hypothetical protein
VYGTDARIWAFIRRIKVDTVKARRLTRFTPGLPILALVVLDVLLRGRMDPQMIGTVNLFAVGPVLIASALLAIRYQGADRRTAILSALGALAVIFMAATLIPSARAAEPIRSQDAAPEPIADEPVADEPAMVLRLPTSTWSFNATGQWILLDTKRYHIELSYPDEAAKWPTAMRRNGGEWKPVAPQEEFLAQGRSLGELSRGMLAKCDMLMHDFRVTPEDPTLPPAPSVQPPVVVPPAPPAPPSPVTASPGTTDPTMPPNRTGGPKDYCDPETIYVTVIGVANGEMESEFTWYNSLPWDTASPWAVQETKWDCHRFCADLNTLTNIGCVLIALAPPPEGVILSAACVGWADISRRNCDNRCEQKP